MTESISFQPIDSLHHPLFTSWLDLYETAFPPEERILVSAFVEMLQQKEAGRTMDVELLAAINASHELVGVAFYDIHPQWGLATLWYMAVNSHIRSQGLGSQIYQEIIQRAKAAGCQAMFFEVEIPELAHTPETKALAERRICFYQRNGAKILQVIRYLQSVGWHQPVTPMHIMIHILQPQTPETAFTFAKQIFEDNLQQDGPLSLV
jgi:GNAT superfamily N-acetyltransferase